MRQHVRARLPIPERIAGAPHLREDLRWVWDAFSDLTTERAPGSMGPPGHVPWTAVRRYADVHGIRGEAFLWFKEVVKAMDDAYLEWVAKSLKEGREGRDGS